MGKIALVFPGQGAQAAGMGKDVYDSHEGARRILDGADEALGFSLTDIVFNGPAELLKQTAYTQPALVAVSLAYYEVFREAGIEADFAAGHSLGEYSALAVAGVISYDDAIRTVRVRGQLMEQAVPAGRGAMAAVLGAERDALAKLCEAVSSETGVVELANVNCPGQIVVSGSQEGVEAVVLRGKEAGAKRVIPLEVSGPFHSSLMRPAARELAEVLDTVELLPAQIPVVANVNAEPVHDPDWIRQLLVQQMFSPVLWEETVRRLMAEGVDTFIEIGSGTVLAGLIKKIDRTVRIVSINSKQAIEDFQL